MPAFIEKASYYLDYEDYREQCVTHLKENSASLKLAIFAAAVSDFHVVKKSSVKIASNSPQALRVEPNEKVIAKLKKQFPQIPFLIFKLEVGLSENQIKNLAKNLLKNYEYVVVNLKEDLKSFKKYFFSREGMKVIHSSEALAEVVNGLV